MTADAFFHLENAEFAQYMKTAISSHHTWLSNLKKMVDERTIIPLQLDSSKCGFGHFYYAMTPDIPGVLPIWEGLEAKHRKFHTYGQSVINALNRADYMEASRIYVKKASVVISPICFTVSSSVFSISTTGSVACRRSCPTCCMKSELSLN